MNTNEWKTKLDKSDYVVYQIDNLIKSLEEHKERVIKGKETGLEVFLEGTLFIPTKDCHEILGSTEPQM
jgi:hypothetical protein